ncbi:MAG: hypothetical protein AAF772_13805, partial [Acidobacteriota bacterium]
MLTACHHHDAHDDHHDHDHPSDHGSATAAGWAITAWGEHVELFPKSDVLIAGTASTAHVHVTRLADFSPLTDGAVSMILRGPNGDEVFRADAPTRPGVFDIALTPQATGEFDLVFRVEAAGIDEAVRGGRVRVGTAADPGGIVVAPAPRGGTDGGEPLPLRKEAQWRSDFATSWVRRGALARSLEGWVQVRPPAGGERRLASPRARGGSAADAWPFPGQRVAGGAPLVRITPLVAAERSLASLEAAVAERAIEARAAAERLARLEQLLALEAVSLRDVEEARYRTEILTTQRAAADDDLQAARAARQRGAS